MCFGLMFHSQVAKILNYPRDQDEVGISPCQSLPGAANRDTLALGRGERTGLYNARALGEGADSH